MSPHPSMNALNQPVREFAQTVPIPNGVSSRRGVGSGGTGSSTRGRAEEDSRDQGSAWAQGGRLAKRWCCLLLLACAGVAAGPARAAQALDESYNQWKQALATGDATGTSHITAREGFTVELIRSAGREEGSWVAMAFDPRGRVVLAREDRGLLRLSLPTNGLPARVEILDTNLLECRGLLFAHGALYANANNSKALVRLRDTTGTDRFDEIKVLRTTPGGVGHGRNQLALGLDGFIYSIHGDDVGLPAGGVSPASPLQHYGEDRLLPCEWDRHLFNADARMPLGHLVRTDRNGESWELVAGGLRNPFGIDFNAAGDLFTFDADMEWDVGLSWYHPTRVLHLVPGGDYGWRRGTGVLPDWSPDTLPSVVDIGVASPTAVRFGTRSRWPEPWKSALFLLDWSYGRILAVHLTKVGASYTGRSEEFLRGRPLNVTGLEFGPDGAMYFVTGGRRTQSGLYRVTWNDATSATEPSPRGAGAGATRRPLADLWTRLDDADPFTRHAARMELEAKPVAEWRARALAEARPTAALTALLALSRVGEPGLQPVLVARLCAMAAAGLDPGQQVMALRVLAVSFVRMGRPAEPLIAEVLETWEPRYPSADARVNQSLCELLVYLGSTKVVTRTLPLIDSAATQEEKFHYLFVLRLAQNGWSTDTRSAYFRWLLRARNEFTGANMLPTALNYIRADAERGLTGSERTALAGALAALDEQSAPVRTALPERSFVRTWARNDLDTLAAPAAIRGDPVRGRRLFTEAGCSQCHRLGHEGGLTGPDLSAVAARFDRRAVLESILEPSKVVAEAYRPVTLTLKSGAIFDGRILGEDAQSLMVAINPVDPDQRRRIGKADIASQRSSTVSPMPSGLLDTLTREEILDLLLWIETGGVPAASVVKPGTSR